MNYSKKIPSSPYQDEFNVIYSADGKQLIKGYNLSGTYVVAPGTEFIASNAFYGCNNLTGIEFPDSLNLIGRGAFCKCRSLTEISLPPHLTQMGEMAFAGCTSLKSVTIPSPLKVILKTTFSHCKNLTSILLPQKLELIEDLAFDSCLKLSEIYLPNTLTYIGRKAFLNCESLKLIDIPQTVAEIAANAFTDCKNLKTAFIRGNSTILADNAFPAETVVSHEEEPFLRRFYKENLHSLRLATTEQLIESFNREVKSKGWTGTRGSYLKALRAVFMEKGWNLAPEVFMPDSMSLAHYIEKSGNSIIIRQQGQAD